MSLTETGATIDYDCAQGTIEGALRLRSDGSFTAEGAHTFEHGGPVHSGEKIVARAARYTGRIEGNRMILSVTLPESGQVLGPYELQRGQPGQVFKCL
jgi:hypothetical protein